VNLDYLFENWRRVLDLSVDHLQLSLVAILIGLLFAVPIGVLVSRYRKLEVPVLGGLSVVYTLPSLAVLAILIPILGLGRQPAIVTLAAYAQVFLVRNIVAGLRGVDPGTIEAAHGVGMTAWQVFTRVRLPLALPIVIAGVRLALVTTISFATITAWIGAGGLGTLLFDGITRNNSSMILAGAIAITSLALLVDQLMRGVEALTPVARARRAG
jgi:osmoprotectant transport system permease protein